MPKRGRSLDALLTEELADDQAASSYINAIISDSPELLPLALRDVARARRMAAVAERADIPRESLYGMLSEDSNPTLDNLTAILSAVGLKMLVVPDSVESEPPSSKDAGATINAIEVLRETVGSQRSPKVLRIGQSAGAERLSFSTPLAPSWAFNPSGLSMAARPEEGIGHKSSIDRIIAQEQKTQSSGLNGNI